MGMYDSVILEMKCPYCGIVSEMEAQTKQLGCSSKCWGKGDFITGKFNYLECMAYCYGCFSKMSQFNATASIGQFYVKIMLEKGFVSGGYEVI